VWAHICSASLLVAHSAFLRREYTSIARMTATFGVKTFMVQ